MCYRVTCHKCSKPTYKGCGRHIEQVLAGVAPDDRCSCDVDDIEDEKEELGTQNEANMGNVFHLNDENFQTTIDSSIVPVLVDFSASWCSPCKVLSKIVDSVAADVGDTALVCKIDIDEAPVTAASFKVRSVPTVMVFIKGQKVNESVGLVTKEKLLKMLGKDPLNDRNATKPEVSIAKAEARNKE